MNFKINNRVSIFTTLEKHCVFSNKNDFIEITEWSNLEGVDINLSAVDGNQMFNLTHGQYSALKKLMKTLEKENIKEIKK